MVKKVSSKELGEIVGITERRVNQLVKSNKIFTKDPDGKFDVVKNVDSWFKTKYQEVDSSSNMKSEQALHEKIKRQKSELQLKIMKGDLHRSKDVEAAMTNMITNAKQRLLGLPSKAAPMVMGFKDLSSIQNVLQKIVEESLAELAEYTVELFRGNETIQTAGDDDD